MTATKKEIKFKEIVSEVSHETALPRDQIEIVLGSILEILAREMSLWPFVTIKFIGEFTNLWDDDEDDVSAGTVVNVAPGVSETIAPSTKSKPERGRKPWTRVKKGFRNDG